MPKPFEGLRDRLLREGIAPRHVNRYVAELGEHLTDLFEDERRRGAGHDAAAHALARLGTDDALAEAMIRRPRLRSWSVRAPWAAYFLVPYTAWSAGIGAVVASFIMIVEAYSPEGGGHPILSFWFSGFTAVESFSVTILLPLLLGWFIAAQATRQRVASFWPVIGLTMIAMASGGIQLTLIPPTGPGQGGEFDVSCFEDPIVAAGWTVLNLALTLVPYLLWRRHVSASLRAPAAA